MYSPLLETNGGVSDLSFKREVNREGATLTSMCSAEMLGKHLRKQGSSLACSLSCKHNFKATTRKLGIMVLGLTFILAFNSTKSVNIKTAKS